MKMPLRHLHGRYRSGRCVGLHVSAPTTGDQVYRSAPEQPVAFTHAVTNPTRTLNNINAPGGMRLPAWGLGAIANESVPPKRVLAACRGDVQDSHLTLVHHGECQSSF